MTEVLRLPRPDHRQDCNHCGQLYQRRGWECTGCGLWVGVPAGAEFQENHRRMLTRKRPNVLSAKDKRQRIVDASAACTDCGARPTAREVAARMGVSTATVSRCWKVEGIYPGHRPKRIRMGRHQPMSDMRGRPRRAEDEKRCYVACLIRLYTCHCGASVSQDKLAAILGISPATIIRTTQWMEAHGDGGS